MPSEPKLTFYRDSKKELRWRVTRKVGNKNRLIGASSEGFKRIRGAIDNMENLGDILTSLTHAFERMKNGGEIQRAIGEFHARGSKRNKS